MKHRSMSLILVSLFIGISLTYAADEIENLFDNPGFEDGKAEEAKQIPGWEVYEQGGVGSFTLDDEGAIEGDQCLFVDIESVPGGGAWNFRVDHSRRFPVKKGKTYTMSFWLKGDGPREVTLSPSRAEQNDAGEWGALASQLVNITEEWEEYHLTFVSGEDRLIMWQILAGSMKGSFWVDYARCYEGEYVEGEIKPAEHAVLPSDKLATQWGRLKLR